MVTTIPPQVMLRPISKFDTELKARMAIHYSAPKGFIGRSLCYAVVCNDLCYGFIVAGSATLHLPGRNEYFGVTKTDLKSIINNTFFNVSRIEGRYPTRNFTVEVLKLFVSQTAQDWQERYGDRVIGFESLVQLPRTGELYFRAGWDCIGVTKGYTCKRVAGQGTDSWTGKRVWGVDNLKPKLVFVRKI